MGASYITDTVSFTTQIGDPIARVAASGAHRLLCQRSVSEFTSIGRLGRQWCESYAKRSEVKVSSPICPNTRTPITQMADVGSLDTNVARILEMAGNLHRC